MADAEASPAPATNPQFATAFRGYDQTQVDEHVTRLADELASAARHRDDATASVAELTKALSYAQNELSDTKSALSRMVDDPAGPAAMTERVKTMMQLAEEEISEMRARGEKEAADVRAAADAYAEKTRNKAHTDAEERAEEAAKERLRLDEEAEQRRREQERSTEEELANQRAAAEKAAAELDRATREKADAMIADAERRLAEAETLRKEAYELRTLVADRLNASQTAVQDAVNRLGVDPEFDAVKREVAANGQGDVSDGQDVEPAPAEGPKVTSTESGQNPARKEPAQKNMTQKSNGGKNSKDKKQAV